jgi:hypothetical protein
MHPRRLATLITVLALLLAAGCNVSREDVVQQVMTGAPLAYLICVSLLATLHAWWKEAAPGLRMRAWIAVLPTLPLALEMVRFLGGGSETDPRVLIFLGLAPFYVFILASAHATVLLLLWRLWMSVHRPTAFEGATLLSTLFYLPGFLIIRGRDPTGQLYQAAKETWLFISCFGLVPTVLMGVLLTEAVVRATRARRAALLVDRAMGVRR